MDDAASGTEGATGRVAAGYGTQEEYHGVSIGSPFLRNRARKRAGTMSSTVSVDLGLGTPRMARGGSHLDPATALAYDENDHVDRDGLVDRLKGLSSAWDASASQGQRADNWEDNCDCCGWFSGSRRNRSRHAHHSAEIGERANVSVPGYQDGSRVDVPLLNDAASIVTGSSFGDLDGESLAAGTDGSNREASIAQR